MATTAKRVKDGVYTQRPPKNPKIPWKTCPDCRGKGDLEGKSCSKCGGKGKIFTTRRHNRCKICGRPRGYLRKFGICRLCFRGLALKGELPGVSKSSW